MQGTAVNISWTSSGVPPSATVRIALYTDDPRPSHYVQTISHAARNTGRFLWTVTVPSGYSEDAYYSLELTVTDNPAVRARTVGSFRVL